MKKLFVMILALSVLMISLLTACGETKTEKSQSQQAKAGETIEKDQNQTPTDPAKELTEDEAIEIALNHAELTKDAVTRLYAEYEIDDGVPTWEINFDHERLEYDYEIHAETGKILSYDVDND